MVRHQHRRKETCWSTGVPTVRCRCSRSPACLQGNAECTQILFNGSRPWLSRAVLVPNCSYFFYHALIICVFIICKPPVIRLYISQIMTLATREQVLTWWRGSTAGHCSQAAHCSCGSRHRPCSPDETCSADTRCREHTGSRSCLPIRSDSPVTVMVVATYSTKRNTNNGQQKIPNN